MPRPKKKPPVDTFKTGFHHLSPSAKQRLRSQLEAAGEIDDETAATALHAVSVWLGTYRSARATLSALPREGEFAERFSRIQAQSESLLGDVRALHPWMTARLTSTGVDVPALASLLESLATVAAEQHDASAGHENRGRPKDQALLLVIRELRIIFRRFRAHPDSDAGEESLDEAGTQSIEAPPAGQGTDSASFDEEVKFIEIALGDAGIKHARPVSQYFDRPGAALPGDRGAVLDRIAANAARARHRRVSGTSRKTARK